MSHNSRIFSNFAQSYKHLPVPFLRANNFITARGGGLYEQQPSISKSHSLLEASGKTRRLFKRVCRLVA